MAAGTPRPIVQRLNAEINAILGSRRQVGAERLGFELTAARREFCDAIGAESDKWAPVIRKTGAKID